MSKSNEVDKSLDAIHSLLCNHFKDVLENGMATDYGDRVPPSPSMLSTIVKFLKDNNATGSLEKDTPLFNLVQSLPTFDGDTSDVVFQ